MGPILQLSNVSKHYGEGARRVDILKDIDLSVADGEFVAIVGFSGAGKTTLISLMAGLIEPDRGGVLFRGREIDGPGPERGVVFQSYSLMPWLSVAGNVDLAVNTVHKAKPRAERAALRERYIGMVGLGRIGIENSGALKVTERIHLDEADPYVLHVEFTFEEPNVLAAPWRQAYRFTRNREWEQIEFVCAENDRNPIGEDGKTDYLLEDGE